jgi:hypothetical protein
MQNQDQKQIAQYKKAWMQLLQPLLKLLGKR